MSDPGVTRPMLWKDEWSRAHEQSPLKVTPENEGRWERYWNVCAAQYARDVESEAPLYRQVIDRLVREGRLRPTDNVLDIGCGPGTFTIPIAYCSRHVVGLDSAAGMIAELASKASMRRLANVEGLPGKWEDFQACDFDLVVSALSPAVCDAEALLKMEKASKRDCCYVTASPGDEMRTRNELWEMVVGDYRPSHAYDVKYALNVLMENGARPDLKHVSAAIEMTVDAEVAISNYQTYFEIFTQMNDEKKGIIKDYIDDRSEDGLLHRKVKKALAVVTWSPNDRIEA